MRGLCKTPSFAQFLCQAQILILGILNVCLWLKFSPSLSLNEIEHFSKPSIYQRYRFRFLFNISCAKRLKSSEAHEKSMFRRNIQYNFSVQTVNDHLFRE
jgi:hypothetical protein